jgi:hypothetical protein
MTIEERIILYQTGREEGVNRADLRQQSLGQRKSEKLRL